MPRGHAPLKILGAAAQAAQAAGRHVAPMAAAARGDDGRMLGDLGETRAELAERDVLSALDVAGGPFRTFADVEEVIPVARRGDIPRLHRVYSSLSRMDLEAVRTRLSEQRDDVSGSLDRLRERLQQSQGDSGGELTLSGQHPADTATETEQRELDLTRSRALEGELATVEGALERVAKGTYGRCVVCGEAIPAERLEVLPQTPYCVKDSAKEQD